MTLRSTPSPPVSTRCPCRARRDRHLDRTDVGGAVRHRAGAVVDARPTRRFTPRGSSGGTPRAACRQRSTRCCAPIRAPRGLRGPYRPCPVQAIATTGTTVRTVACSMTTATSAASTGSRHLEDLSPRTRDSRGGRSRDVRRLPVYGGCGAAHRLLARGGRPADSVRLIAAIGTSTSRAMAATRSRRSPSRAGAARHRCRCAARDAAAEAALEQFVQPSNRVAAPRRRVLAGAVAASGRAVIDEAGAHRRRRVVPRAPDVRADADRGVGDSRR